MREFKNGDSVVLLKERMSYTGDNIPVGTKGVIITLDSVRSDVYYVNFGSYGVHSVTEANISLASEGVLCADTDASYMKFINEKYITTSSNVVTGTFDIALLIKDVIYNDPATIIFWKDGTKTVVKCNDEEYDPEKGFAMAVCKKVFGNEGNYYNTFKKWLPEEIEFEVGEIVTLSKEIYGLSVGTLVHIADIDKEKENSYIVRTNTGWKFTVDKKYLRLC